MPRRNPKSPMRLVRNAFLQASAAAGFLYQNLMKDYSLTGLTRGEMIYNKEKLLQLGGVHNDQIRKWKRKAEEAVEQGVTP